MSKRLDARQASQSRTVQSDQREKKNGRRRDFFLAPSVKERDDHTQQDRADCLHAVPIVFFSFLSYFEVFVFSEQGAMFFPPVAQGVLRRPQRLDGLPILRIKSCPTEEEI